MPEFILEITQDHTELAHAEINALGGRIIPMSPRYIRIKKLSKKNISRLAYTKNAYEILGTISIVKKETEKTSQEIIQTSLFTKERTKKIDASITSYKMSYKEIPSPLQKKLNTYVWEKIKNKKVKLQNPSHEFFCMYTEKNRENKSKTVDSELKNTEVYFTLKIKDNTDNFSSRMPHKRKHMRPISLHPRLARCMVNLTGCKRGTIVDPFTGTSGILIEALLCNLTVKGYDISEEMIQISEENIKEYTKTKKLTLMQRDFFSITEKINYIVTDPPYGKNTTKISSQFYADLLKHLSKILKKTAVIAFPHTYTSIENDIQKTQLEIKNTYTYYIHKSLSKKIYVIEKKSK